MWKWISSSTTNVKKPVFKKTLAFQGASIKNSLPSDISNEYHVITFNRKKRFSKIVNKSLLFSAFMFISLIFTLHILLLF